MTKFYAALLTCTALVPVSILIPPSAAQAEENTVYSLGEVHVSATTEADAPGTDTLSQEEIRLLNRETLDQALNTMAGVSISQTGGQRNERTYYIRGMDRWRVPLYIDGIRVYLPADNRVDMARFTTADIAEIQVTKGYSSVINGPGAMGGSVNLVSRQVAKPLEGDLRTGVTFDGNGAFNGFTTDLFTGTRQDKWYVQGFGQWAEKTHTRLSDSYDGNSIENGGNRNQSDKQDYKINLKVGYVPDALDEYSLNFIRQEGEKSSPPNTTPGATNRYWQWPEWRKQSLYWISKTTADDGSYLKVRAFYDWMDNTLDFYDDASYTTQNNTSFGVWSQYRDNAFGTSIEGAKNLLGQRDTLRAALHLRRDIHREQNLYNQVSGGVTSRILEPQQKDVEDTYSAAVENTFRIQPQWDVTGGVGYDYRIMQHAEDWSTNNTGGTNVNGHLINYPLTNDHAINPQVATVYRYSDTGSVSASIEQRTRFPTLFERYSNRFGTVTGNPSLKAETARNAQIGAKDRVTGNTTVGGNVFYSYISDAITSVAATVNGVSTTQNQNVGHARHKGFELESQTQLRPDLSIGGNYTFLQADTTTKTARLTNIPRHKAIVYADWEAVSAVHVVPSVEVASERWLQNSYTNAYYRGGDMGVANLKLSYQPLSNLTMEVGANNIFDADYTTTDGYPEEGRNYFANVRVTF